MTVIIIENKVSSVHTFVGNDDCHNLCPHPTLTREDSETKHNARVVKHRPRDGDGYRILYR